MADAATADLDLLTGDEKIVVEAKKRFQRCEVWESNFRKEFVQDVKFANADSANGWQWPNDIRRNRDIDERPCLTVNKTHVHCLQIINDAKQNKPSIKMRATGGDASFESSEILEGIVRRIEYQSNATAAYDTATVFQVEGGIGYWRVVTAYASEDETSEDAFNQEIFIRRIKDPLNVYLDPDINEQDGSDARFGFVFDNMPREEFEDKYPKHKHIAGRAALGNTDNWLTKEHVRVAEYYRVVDHDTKVVAFVDPTTGTTTVMPEKEIPVALREMVLAQEDTRTRMVTNPRVEWYLIAGEEIIDSEDWPGKYIPIVRLVGEETIVEGELDRKGHTRALRDPQRIYNYWTSSAVEFVALQSKTPYKAAVAAIEGVETYWESANRVNHAVLPYNHIDDAGNPIPAPEREQPPVMASAYVQGMQISAGELMMVSGQYQATMGAPSNETSGKAINQRQRQGENATYHFIDNLGHAVRYTGKIILDLIPHIYDTPRVMKIMAEDDTMSNVFLDPKAKAAYVKEQSKLTMDVKHIFNPNVGKYEVESDIGPSYGTRREEAFNAFSQIAAQNPALMSVIGDLLFKNADFPGADKIAERLARMIPPQATGDAPPPEVQQMQMQLQNLQQVSTNLMQELVEAKKQIKSKDIGDSVDEYRAITDRLKALLPTMINPTEIAQAIITTMKAEQEVLLPPTTTQRETSSSTGLTESNVLQAPPTLQGTLPQETLQGNAPTFSSFASQQE